MKLSSLRSLLSIATLAAVVVFAAPQQAHAFGVNIELGAPSSPPPPPPPPPPSGPVVYASPGPGAVWVDGHWEWERHGWVWWPGYWEYPPHPGAVWITAGWADHDGRRYYRHGYWR